SSSGWSRAGDHPADYDMGVDQTTAFTGSSSGYIKSNKPAPQGFGTYMQTVDATEYRGKRLRLSAYVRSENVENWAGVWMRVDRDKKPVAFDNMYPRAIRDTQGWTKHAIVLDVDSKATVIAFGILLSGKGAVWIDDVAFDVVGEEVPVTDLTVQKAASPRNLDFENTPERR
ncbi:MAG: AraC family transcriptional regulator, partial [Vicinamibacterales bacterium]